MSSRYSISGNFAPPCPAVRLSLLAWYIILGPPHTHTTDHTITKSVYFLDPDSNQLEIFAEGFDEPSEAMNFIRQGTYRVKPLELEIPSAT